MILLLACAADPAPPTVVLVVLDTVRADAIGEDTPAFSSFAEEGVRFDRAWSAAPWTLPSHGSLFTGLPEEQHGCTAATLRCDSGAEMIAERFSAAGYATAGFSNNPWVTGETGLAEGFDLFVEVFQQAYGVGHAVARYTDIDATGLRDAGAERTVASVGAWLDGVEGPAFLFVNFIEAHLPYDPPGDFRGRFRADPVHWVTDRRRMDELLPDAFAGTLSEQDLLEARALYREEVAYVDAQLGELLQVLADHGRGDALVVVTSDHGEAFGEHELGSIQLVDHQLSVYDELLHVPLAVRWPGVMPPGHVEAADVGLRDVAPLLRWALDREGVPALLSPTPNRTFSAIYAPPSNLGPVLARLAPAEASALSARTLRTVRRGRDKLIVPSDGPPLLFDVVADPAERWDLAAQRPEHVRSLYSLLPPVPAAPLAGPSPSTTDALRALGYVR